MLHRIKTIIELDQTPLAEVSIISRRIDYITIELKHKSKMDTKYAWLDSIVAKLSHWIEIRGRQSTVERSAEEAYIDYSNKNTHESRHRDTNQYRYQYNKRLHNVNSWKKKKHRTIEIVVVAKMRIKNDACCLFMFITNRSKKRRRKKCSKNNRERERKRRAPDAIIAVCVPHLC